MPQARLVAVLRDPVDRAHCNWTHLRSAGLEPEADFLRACALEQSRADAGWGAVLALRRARALRRAARAACTATFPREQVLVLLYRDVRDGRSRRSTGSARSSACRPGCCRGCRHATSPCRPVRGAATRPSPAALRAVTARARAARRRCAPRSPRRWPASCSASSARARPRPPPQRAALLPLLEDDIRLAERLTGLPLDHWRDLHNGADRAPLDVRGRFGTAFDSIDRPGR